MQPTLTTYLIAYDLVPPNLKYAEIIKRLRRMEPERPIETLLATQSVNPDSTYLLRVSLSADEILDKLREPGGIDGSDKVLIAAIKGEIVRHPAR